MKLGNRSVFDLTHERKLSCDMGQLVPCMCEEVLPGDTFKVKADMLVRIAPMLAPVMHRITAFTHYFFVPTRLLHTNWESFITGGSTGTDATVVPTVTSGESGQGAGTLWDYFGLPIGVANVSALAYPFRAYAKIFNEWYRDQNMQSPVALSLADGADTTTSMALLNRCWEKDYLTSCLPWPQRGTAVSIPLGTEAPVSYKTGLNSSMLVKQKGNDVIYSNGASFTTGSSGEWKLDGTEVVLDPTNHLKADLTNASAATINALRQAFQLQKWMERNARGGVRYVESILAHFGIRSSDARLQRPEFLGGGRSPIVISEVLQTSKTDGSPQGNMAGHGYSAQRTHAFNKSFEEHGYVIGILSILPRTAYQQGIERMWNRRSRLDWYWPEFAHLGEQGVANKEVYAAAASPDGTFGYVGRYDEYRKRSSVVCGDFRTTLNYWHMGRIFQSEPSLNAAFVSADPTKRILAATGEHGCWIQMLNQIQAVRLMPKSGVPGMIDH